VKALLTAGAIVAALLLQSALAQLAPVQARLFDPFLLVVVYCALSGGEVHGMLAGLAAGWVQDVHFGPTVVGLSALTKILVGFAVGVAGTRFLLVGTGPRILVIFAATVADALLLERLASVFDIPAYEMSLEGLLARATLDSLVGAAVFEVLSRRSVREALR
jgi:rod shape-determining protein MreD